MRNLVRTSTLAIVAAALLAAPSAQAQEATPKGWDTKYAVLFSLNNIFQNGTILGNYQGYGLGAQYNLSPKMALRFGLGFSHTSDPAYTADRTTLTAGNPPRTTKVLVAPAAGQWTSTLNMRLGADYLVGLTESSLMPYVGAGAAVGFGSNKRAFTDNIDPTDVTKVDDYQNGFSLGVRGVLGVQWRLHKAFSVYAEYALGVDILDYTSTQTRTENTTTTTVTGTTTKGSQSQWLTATLGLAQGGSLGVVAFF